MARPIPSSTRPDAPCRGLGRVGFTLTELLVVIIIIGILMAIVLSVSSAVMDNSRQSATRDVMRQLDALVEAYVAERGEPPPATLNDVVGGVVIPIIDGKPGEDEAMPVINTVGLFLTQMNGLSATKSLVSALPSRSIRPFDANGTAAPETPGSLMGEALPTVFDAWGRPIRYVHPAMDGRISVDPGPAVVDVEDTFARLPSGSTWAFERVIRAEPRDTMPPETPYTDLGRAPGTLPYFYSLGADGRAGPGLRGVGNFNGDNVYTTQPLLD